MIPELLQGQVTPVNIAKELTSLLEDSVRRNTMIDDLHAVKEALGGEGAVKRVAQVVANVAGAANSSNYGDTDSANISAPDGDIDHAKVSVDESTPGDAN